MTKPTVSFRLSQRTREQIAYLAERRGCSGAETITIAIESMYTQENRSMSANLLNPARQIKMTAQEWARVYEYEALASAELGDPDTDRYAFETALAVETFRLTNADGFAHPVQVSIVQALRKMRGYSE